MKRIFKAEIIWDTNDEHGLYDAMEDLMDVLNKKEGIEVVLPYQSEPIVLIIK